MKYDRFLAKLLLFCSFIVPLQGMQSNVGYALRELSKRLNDVHSTLRQSQTGLKDLPIEVIEKMLLDSIPDFREMKPADAERAFKDTVKYLNNFSQTNKEYYGIFLEPTFKRAIMRKLFNGLSYEILKNIPVPKNISVDKTVISDVANALYYMRLLHDNLPRDFKIVPEYREQNIKDAFQKLVATGISPNFFVGYRNLFHMAIVYDFPQIVIDMIHQGADVGMLTKNYEGKQVLPAPSPIMVLDYNQIPFVLAFSYSPESALYLLNQNLVDVETIEKHLSQTWAYCNMYNDPRKIKHHVQYYTQIIKQLVENGIDANTEIVVDAPSNVAIRNSFLALFLSYYSIYSSLGNEDPKVLEIIKFLLDKGAKINKGYYMMTLYKTQNPLEFARMHKGSYPELYDLIEQYKDNPDNN